MQVETSVFCRKIRRRTVQLALRHSGYGRRVRSISISTVVDAAASVGKVLRMFVSEHADGQHLPRGLRWPRKPIRVVSASVSHSPVNCCAGHGQKQNRAGSYKHNVFKRGTASQSRSMIFCSGIVSIRPAASCATDSVTRPARKQNIENIISYILILPILNTY